MVAVVIDREVRVEYTKYDGSLHWHFTMGYLGADEHGTWLGAREGLLTRRGSEPPITIEQSHVLLVPEGQWWTAIFNGEPVATEIYCDICTIPRWLDEARVTMADLDLDVIRLRPDREVLLLDEDEFAEHQVRYGYPADVIAEAERTAAWLQDAIRAEAEPFAAAYRPWLDKVS
jgi:uncharacterized protein